MRTGTSRIFEGGEGTACNCMGPQRGQPFCPCQMRLKRIYQRNGRWVEPPRDEIDHGPVTDIPDMNSTIRRFDR